MRGNAIAVCGEREIREREALVARSFLWQLFVLSLKKGRASEYVPLFNLGAARPGGSGGLVSRTRATLCSRGSRSAQRASTLLRVNSLGTFLRSARCVRLGSRD